MNSSTPTTGHIASRIAASLIGGWTFIWGFSTLGIVGLVAAGQRYDEAQTAVTLIAMVLFLVVFCWSFAAASITRLWFALLGGGALMTGAAWLLQRSLT